LADKTAHDNLVCAPPVLLAIMSERLTQDGQGTRRTFHATLGVVGADVIECALHEVLQMALKSLWELPLVEPLSGAKQTLLWQPPETGFGPKQPTAPFRRTGSEGYRRPDFRSFACADTIPNENRGEFQ
jgi:hypothetical protein